MITTRLDVYGRIHWKQLFSYPYDNTRRKIKKKIKFLWFRTSPISSRDPQFGSREWGLRAWGCEDCGLGTGTGYNVLYPVTGPCRRKRTETTLVSFLRPLLGLYTHRNSRNFTVIVTKEKLTLPTPLFDSQNPPSVSTIPTYTVRTPPSSDGERVPVHIHETTNQRFLVSSNRDSLFPS